MADYGKFVTIPETKLKVKDAFVLNDFFKIIIEWCKEYGYVAFDGGSAEDFETVYTHRFAGPGGSILDGWVWWRMVKYPSGTNAKTAYLRFRMDLDFFFLLDAKKVEVMHMGKKVKLDKGEIEVLVRPFLELDFRNEWNSKGVLGLVSDVFKKKIYKREIEMHRHALFNNDAAKLMGVMKEFLQLQKYVPSEGMTYYPKGLKEQ